MTSVSEIIETMTAQKKDNGKTIYNRFNRKNFEKLLRAMMNDPEYATEVAHVKNGELSSVEQLKVTEGFRKFCKRVVEKMGVDKSESAKIMTADFTFDNVEGLYEFFATAIYEYIQAGNTFDFISKPDFRGGLRLKEADESVKETTAYSPQNREECLGTYEITKPKHKVLAVKSSCPKYLVQRRKIK